jgi:hypothetical protein
MTNNKSKPILAILIMLLLVNCTEVVVGPKDTVSNTFFKQYSNSNSEANTYVGKSSKGFLMAGFTLTNDKLIISHCNDLGELDWEKDIPIDLSLGKVIAFPSGLKLKDGSFIINDLLNPTITRITENGEIIYSKWISQMVWETRGAYSPFVESNNGFCYVSHTLGADAIDYKSNYIAEIDPVDGSTNRVFQYDDTAFGGKVIRFDLAKAEGTTLWLTGNTQKNYVGDPWKLKLMKIR